MKLSLNNSDPVGRPLGVGDMGHRHLKATALASWKGRGDLGKSPYSTTLKSRSTGFTIPELLAVIAIISIILSILLPALGVARGRARLATSSSNLHQVQVAMLGYGLDHQQFLPPRFEVKKNVLSASDYFTKGKRLNTLTLGIQTVLARYADAGVFRDPGDVGDSVSSKPVYQRKGVSYDVKGVNYLEQGFSLAKDGMENKVNYYFHESKELARSLFKPWEADDPAKVLEKVAKNELGPIHWHGGVGLMVMGDGHVAQFRTKAEEKIAKGQAPDEDDQPDHIDKP